MANRLASHLVGKTIKSFVIRENSWCGMEIEGGYHFGIETLCRYVGSDGSFVSAEDHRQQFGLSQPYDAETAIAKAIVGKIIKDVVLRQNTSDVALHLPEGLLEIICSSAGYESYQIRGPKDLIIVGRAGDR